MESIPYNEEGANISSSGIDNMKFILCEPFCEWHKLSTFWPFIGVMGVGVKKTSMLSCPRCHSQPHGGCVRHIVPHIVNDGPDKLTDYKDFSSRRERRRACCAVMEWVAVRLHTGCYITRDTLHHVGYMVQSPKVRGTKPSEYHLQTDNTSIHLQRYTLTCRSIIRRITESHFAPYLAHERVEFRKYLQGR